MLVCTSTWYKHTYRRNLVTQVLGVIGDFADPAAILAELSILWFCKNLGLCPKQGYEEKPVLLNSRFREILAKGFQQNIWVLRQVHDHMWLNTLLFLSFLS